MTNPDNVGGLRYTDYNVMNGALCDFSTRWKMDGDYIRCRTCKRPQLTSYGDNDFPHASDCRDRNSPTMERRPWQTYVALLAPLCRAAPAGGDSLRLLVKELRESLEGVVRVADRNTDEFDRAREAIARAARVFVNAGDSEAQFIADSRDLNCPACGGSGHVDDSAPAGSGEVADDVMKIADFFEGVRVFVTSREKIKHPEGTDLFDWHVKRLRRTAALLRKLQQGADYVIVPREVADSIAHCVEKDLRPYFETVVKWHVLIASQGQEGVENG